MATKKTDTVRLDFNLDKVDLPEEARPYRFTMGGERFETVDLAELKPEPLMEAWRRSEAGDLYAIVQALLSGADYTRFRGLSPTVWQLAAVNDAMTPVFKVLFGEPEGFTGSATK